MFKKAVVFLLISLLAGWAPASIAAASEDIQTVHDGGLWATGKGFVRLKGKGNVELKSVGEGILRIENVSATKIKIVGQGKITPLPNKDAILISGLKGRVELKGKKMEFTFNECDVTILAKGDGAVWLKGKGLFKIGHKPKHKWPDKVKKFTY